MKVSFFIVSIRHEWGHTNYGLRERLNGIQEVSGSIPLISTILTSKSIDFEVFCRPYPVTFLERKYIISAISWL